MLHQFSKQEKRKRVYRSSGNGTVDEEFAGVKIRPGEFRPFSPFFPFRPSRKRFNRSDPIRTNERVTRKAGEELGERRPLPSRQVRVRMQIRRHGPFTGGVWVCV